MLSNKKNCPLLYETLVNEIDNSPEKSYYVETDSRKVTRKTTVCPIDDSKLPPNWKGITAAICVQRIGYRYHKQTTQTAYFFVKGTVPSAQVAAALVRRHWEIENGLHRTKDVIYREDKNRIKNKERAANWSLLLNFTYNSFIFMGFKSVTIAIEKLANQVQELYHFATQTHYEKFCSC